MHDTCVPLIHFPRQQFKGVFPGFPGVDDHRLAAFPRGLQVGNKIGALQIAIGAVMIVQAGFTNRHHFGVARVLDQLRNGNRVGYLLQGMNAD